MKRRETKYGTQITDMSEKELKPSSLKWVINYITNVIIQNF